MPGARISVRSTNDPKAPTVTCSKTISPHVQVAAALECPQPSHQHRTSIVVRQIGLQHIIDELPPDGGLLPKRLEVVCHPETRGPDDQGINPRNWTADVSWLQIHFDP